MNTYDIHVLYAQCFLILLSTTTVCMCAKSYTGYTHTLTPSHMPHSHTLTPSHPHTCHTLTGLPSRVLDGRQVLRDSLPLSTTPPPRPLTPSSPLSPSPRLPPSPKPFGSEVKGDVIQLNELRRINRQLEQCLGEVAEEKRRLEVELQRHRDTLEKVSHIFTTSHTSSPSHHTLPYPSNFMYISCIYMYTLYCTSSKLIH